MQWKVGDNKIRDKLIETDKGKTNPLNSKSDKAKRSNSLTNVQEHQRQYETAKRKILKFPIANRMPKWWIPANNK